MHARRRERLAQSRVIELPDYLAGGFDRLGIAQHAEFVTAAVYGDAEPPLQLPQVLIERSAEICQPLIVSGLQRNIAGVGEIGL